MFEYFPSVHLTYFSIREYQFFGWDHNVLFLDGTASQYFQIKNPPLSRSQTSPPSLKIVAVFSMSFRKIDIRSGIPRGSWLILWELSLSDIPEEHLVNLLHSRWPQREKTWCHLPGCHVGAQ